MTTLAVCGGRDFTNKAQLMATLDTFVDPPELVITGGADGADTLAEEWARFHSYEVVTKEPDWDRHGEKAGLIRNSEIIALADLLVAFPTKKSRGTWDTVNKAKKKGIPYMVFPEEEEGRYWQLGGKTEAEFEAEHHHHDDCFAGPCFCNSPEGPPCNLTHVRGEEK
jgi:hypothetical protein